MTWITGLAIFSIVAGVTLSIVVLVAIGSLRRSLNEGALRQGQQIKRLIETVSVLHQQQQSSNARIQVLAEANRKLAEQLAALGERVGDSEVPVGGTHRVLH